MAPLALKGCHSRLQIKIFTGKVEYFGHLSTYSARIMVYKGFYKIPSTRNPYFFHWNPVLETLKNPYSFSTTIISGWQYRFFKLLFLHVWWCIWNIFDHFVETHEYFCLKEGMAIFKPFYHSDRVLMTLVFPRNPVLGRKNPFKPNPYKPYCV